MGNFVFQETGIKDLMVITPFCAPDQRGVFSKTYERSVFAEHGIDLVPWEELRSSSRKGVLRGLHFQRRYSQDKLVQVSCGAVYDVAVDLRTDSPTFGKWEGFYLTAENQQILYIPKDFAHGFLTLEDNTLVNYLCGDRYDPASSSGIRWDDPDIGVAWPLERIDHVIISEKDAALPSLTEYIETAKMGKTL